MNLLFFWKKKLFNSEIRLQGAAAVGGERGGGKWLKPGDFKFRLREVVPQYITCHLSEKQGWILSRTGNCAHVYIFWYASTQIFWFYIFYIFIFYIGQACNWVCKLYFLGACPALILSIWLSICVLEYQNKKQKRWPFSLEHWMSIFLIVLSW